jgi:hypothetical protein
MVTVAKATERQKALYAEYASTHPGFPTPNLDADESGAVLMTADDLVEDIAGFRNEDEALARWRNCTVNFIQAFREAGDYTEAEHAAALEKGRAVAVMETDEAGREARFARELLAHPLAATVIDELEEFYTDPGNFDADHAAIGTLLVEEAFKALREKAGVPE